MRYKILSVFAALAAVTACGDLTSINQNPNGPVDVPPPSILPSVIQTVVGGVNGVNSLNIRGGGLWVQYYSEIQYRDEDKYLVRSGTSGGWGFYNGALEDIQRMIQKGVAANAPNWSAVGRIMKAYTFSVMTDAMGDLPYSQALKADTVLQPAYDTQQFIYNSSLADLAQASSEVDFSSSATGFPTGDLLYGGKLAKWQKFANSLRLRLAIHLSNVDATKAASEAAAAVAAGVFTSNAHNAQLMYLGSSPNRNPIYNDARGRDDYGMSKTFVDSLTRWNDPRLPVFAQVNKDTIVANRTYQGLPNGLDNGDGPALFYISRIGADWRETAIAPMALLTYSEVLFLEAQAAVAYDAAGANVTGHLRQIASQKWVSLFMQGMESWTEVRRTGVPALVPGPKAVLTSIPERLPYDDNEAVLNASNLAAAVAAQGFSQGNDITAPLWFTGRQ